MNTMSTYYILVTLNVPDPERDAFEDGPPPTVRIMRYESSLQAKNNMLSPLYIRIIPSRDLN